MSDLDALVSAACARAHAKLRGVLTSGRFRALILETAAWAAAGDWLVKGGKVARRRGAAADRFVAKPLDRRLEGVFKPGKDLLALDDAGRHRVRIQAKKLRYAAEAFAPLFPKVDAKPFIKLVKALQEDLGALNDVAVAQALVERLAPQGEALMAAQQLIAARGAGRAGRLKAADKVLRKLAKAETFWVR
jgi:triphosphatase